MNKEDKILITGYSGMLGKSICEEFKDFNIITYKNIDLFHQQNVKKCFEFFRPKYVIHLAAKVGGVKANSEQLGAFFTENIYINTNILHYSYLYRVKKVVSILSTCIYPNKVNYPLTEDQIHNGEPHKSNYGYAHAKRMLDIQSRAYREQYGCNFITIVPNNLFGFNDNYNLQNSHLLPAIMRKIYEAKLNDENPVLWGDGSPKREFTYSKDLAKIIKIVMDYYDDPYPINVGNTNEYSIKEIAEVICDIVAFSKEKIIWDTSKPSGQFRKPSSNKKFMDLLSKNNINFEYTDFRVALEETYKWFVDNYPNVRGMK